MMGYLHFKWTSYC